MLRTLCAIVCGVSIAMSVMACDGEGDDEAGYQPWVPDGWIVLAADPEDVNGDGIPDASLLLEAEGVPGIRRFLVLLGTPDGSYDEEPLVDVVLPSKSGDDDPSYRDT